MNIGIIHRTGELFWADFRIITVICTKNGGRL